MMLDSQQVFVGPDGMKIFEDARGESFWVSHRILDLEGT